jgi:predicted DNA-binding protein
MAEQTVVLAFRVPEWMAERMRQMARAEHRTMANLLRIWLERALTAQEESDVVRSHTAGDATGHPVGDTTGEITNE